MPGVVWSPMLLVLGPALAVDDFIGTLVGTGEGSGAIGVVVVGLCGGAALSGRGPVWARAVAGIPVATAITGAMVVAFYVRDQAVTASGVFGGLHLAILMVWLAVGCSLPLRESAAQTAVADDVVAGSAPIGSSLS